MLAREAVDVLRDQEPSVELAQATAQLAYMRFLEGARDEGGMLAGRAVQLGERFGDAWALSNGLLAKASSLRWSAPTEALALGLRARDVAVEAGLPETAVRAYTIASMSLAFNKRPREERLALIEEGLAYGRSRGVEEMFHLPMVYSAALAAGGEWDRALEVIHTARSVNRLFLIRMEAAIVLGRDGPRAALPLFLDAADRAVRAHLAYDFMWFVASAATACALADDVLAARGWLERLDSRLEEDEAARSFLSGAAPATWTLIAALLCDEPDWVERVEKALLAREGDTRGESSVLRAVGALLAGDAVRCAAELERTSGADITLMDEAGIAFVTTICAREAKRRGLSIGPGWKGAITRSRAFAELAAARWYVEELDRATGH
jgi:hypothetical protein